MPARKYQPRAKKPVAKPRAKAAAKPKYRYKYSKYGQAVGGTLPAIGGIAGGFFGGPPGAAVGRSIGGLGQSIIKGYGDYNVEYNTVLSGQIPRMANSGRAGGGIMISFREYLGDVVSSSVVNSFDNVTYEINPTNERTFPWLSQISGNFQEWVAHGIVFEFRSMSADALNSTNTSLGQCIMATNYNAGLSPYSSKAEAENSEYAKSIKPSFSCMHAIECAKSATVLGNLYTNNARPSDDIRFTTLGKFQMMTNGMQGTDVNVGELWVTYQIELLKPKIHDSLGEDVSCLWVTSEDVATARPFGQFNTIKLRDSGNLNTIQPNSSNFFFPYSALDKTYLLQIHWSGSAFGVTSVPTFALTDGAEPHPDMFYETGPILDDVSSTGIQSEILVVLDMYVDVKGGSASARITLSNNGAFPTDCVMDLKLIESPNSFVSTTTFNDFLESQP